MFMRRLLFLSVVLFQVSCQNPRKGIAVGFLDAFKDETLEQAHKGFCDALAANGFVSGKNDFSIEYRNAQGDVPTLVQACDYFTSVQVTAIAANPTVSTITAVQHGKGIPVCMMVSPEPVLAGLCTDSLHYPKQLFGVYETQDYIDTSVMLMKTLVPDIQSLAVLYNMAEVQSVLALKRMKVLCEALHINLTSRGINQSSEVQQAMLSMLQESPDAFFALPDNSVFAAFETIVRTCDKKNIPVFTSESGLVKRGALAAYGADMYRWGYQSGEQMAAYLKNPSVLPKPVLLKGRIKMMNRKQAAHFKLQADSTWILM
jgi:putative ABC transport system substrate-binding protein